MNPHISFQFEVSNVRNCTHPSNSPTSVRKQESFSERSDTWDLLGKHISEADFFFNL